jgi:hypothetical protein
MRRVAAAGEHASGTLVSTGSTSPPQPEDSVLGPGYALALAVREHARHRGSPRPSARQWPLGGCAYLAPMSAANVPLRLAALQPLVSICLEHVGWCGPDELSASRETCCRSSRGVAAAGEHALGTALVPPPKSRPAGLSAGRSVGSGRPGACASTGNSHGPQLASALEGLSSAFGPLRLAALQPLVSMPRARWLARP